MIQILWNTWHRHWLSFNAWSQSFFKTQNSWHSFNLGPGNDLFRALYKRHRDLLKQYYVQAGITKGGRIIGGGFTGKWRCVFWTFYTILIHRSGSKGSPEWGQPPSTSNHPRCRGRVRASIRDSSRRLWTEYPLTPRNVCGEDPPARLGGGHQEIRGCVRDCWTQRI